MVLVAVLSGLTAVSAGGGIASAARALALPRAAHTTRVTFGIQPAGLHRPDGRSDFAFGVTPGASLSDHVAVVNYSARPLSLQLYATDAVNTSDGGFGLLPGGVRPTGAGAWLTLPAAAATVNVPGKRRSGRPGEVIVPFTLKVPDTASPGDHAGGIVASLRSIGRNKSGQAIVLDQRVAIRVFIRVAGTLKPELAISDVHATYHGGLDPFGRGRVTVRYQVTNTGNEDYGLAQGVGVSGLVGGGHSVAVGWIPLLLPGDSVTEAATVRGVWPQIRDRVSVTERPMAAPGEDTPSLSSQTARAAVWAMPWALVLLVVVVVAAGYLGYRTRASRAAGPGQASPSPERVSA